MEVLMVLIIAASNAACLIIGAKVGQKVAKGEPVKIRLPNPVAAIREEKAHREEDRAQSILEAQLRNIEKYDGTGLGQEDIPR